jgi:hypothetical protein
MEAIHLLIDIVLFSALALGVLSFILSERKSRGLTGAGLAAFALALGGSRVQIEGPVAKGLFLGLDWFLLSIFFWRSSSSPSSDSLPDFRISVCSEKVGGRIWPISR